MIEKLTTKQNLNIDKNINKYPLNMRENNNGGK